MLIFILILEIRSNFDFKAMKGRFTGQYPDFPQNEC